MEGRFINNSFITKHEESKNSPENSCDSPPTIMFADCNLLASTSSPSKRGRRSIKKRVVKVPIKEIDGSRLKGEIGNAPPSDSWAWRKYGQKPIKGSPYPRGYYRCSSSKGCPARKQVERSNDEPNVLLVTYSCEHNHSWPATRHNQKSQNSRLISSMTTIMDTASPIDAVCKSEQEEEEEEEEENDNKQHTPTTTNNKFNNVGNDNQQVLSLIGGGEFGWLSDFECSSRDRMLESEILTGGRVNNEAEFMNIDLFGCSKMLEEDELLFADLGELPECSKVFSRGMIQRDEEWGTPWCGTIS